MWKVVGSKNKSCHWASQKFREEVDVADISIMEPGRKSSRQDLRRSLKVELIGLGVGLGVVIRGRVCSVEFRFSIKEV